MNRYLAIFKRSGTDPDPGMEEGWFSIALEAHSVDVAERWALYRASLFEPWLNAPLDLVLVEPYKPSPEWAGPYRGLVVRM